MMNIEYGNCNTNTLQQVSIIQLYAINLNDKEVVMYIHTMHTYKSKSAIYYIYLNTTELQMQKLRWSWVLVLH